MNGGIISRLLGLVLATFLIAVIYGLFLTTVDFMKPGYNPVTSGHRAAQGVYGVFGTVDNEIRNNDEGESKHTTSVLRKIAKPYAIAADLSAILGGKIELVVSSLFHRTVNKASDLGTHT